MNDVAKKGGITIKLPCEIFQYYIILFSYLLFAESQWVLFLYKFIISLSYFYELKTSDHCDVVSYSLFLSLSLSLSLYISIYIIYISRPSVCFYQLIRICAPMHPHSYSILGSRLIPSKVRL